LTPEVDSSRKGRDWMFCVRLPSVDLRDRLIEDVVKSVTELTEPPAIAVRMIEVPEDQPVPTLGLQLRFQLGKVTESEALTSAGETLATYAPKLDLSAIEVVVR